MRFNWLFCCLHLNSGPHGPKGEPGNVSEKGLQWDFKFFFKNIWEIIFCYQLIDLLSKFSNKGQKGEPGPSGLRGIDGIDGATGDVGPKGDAGVPGFGRPGLTGKIISFFWLKIGKNETKIWSLSVYECHNLKNLCVI